jgi:hypothetical protein
MISGNFTTALARAPEDSRRRPVLLAMRERHEANLARRRRVLSHDDLRRRLETDLGYARADQWNGYVPPRLDPEDDGELCRMVGRNGLVRLNERGARSEPSGLSNSPRRALLVDICAEAARRETAA